MSGNSIDQYSNKALLHNKYVYLTLSGDEVYFDEPNAFGYGNKSYSKDEIIGTEQIPKALLIQQQLEYFRLVPNVHGNHAFDARNDVIDILQYLTTLENADSVEEVMDGLRKELQKEYPHLDLPDNLQDLPYQSNIPHEAWNVAFVALDANLRSQNLLPSTGIVPETQSRIDLQVIANNVLQDSGLKSEQEMFKNFSVAHPTWNVIGYLGSRPKEEGGIGAYDSNGDYGAHYPNNHYANYIRSVYEIGLTQMQNSATEKFFAIKISLLDTDSILNQRRQKARDWMAQEIGDNPEVKFTLDNGFQWIIDLDPETALSVNGTFIPYSQITDTGNDDQSNVQNFAGGLADFANQTIHINADDRAFFSIASREEASHIVDRFLGEELGLDQHLSHLFVRDYMIDDVKGSDLQRIKATGEQKDQIETEFNAAFEKTGLDIGYPQHILHYELIKGGGELSNIMQLSGEVYKKTRETQDSDLKNKSEDTEVMVKFHRLRMRLEDEAAQHTQGYEANHYGSESPVLDILETLAPQLTKAYAQGWLPAVKIAVIDHPDDPEARKQALWEHIKKISSGDSPMIDLKDVDNSNGDKDYIVMGSKKIEFSSPVPFDRVP